MAYPLEKLLSEEDLNNIITDYKNGLSISKISKKYNRCKESLSKMLSRLGVKTKFGSECIRKFYFDLSQIILDSPDKYYWLGFISGDGSVGNKEKRLKIELQEKDEELLIKFKTFFKTNAIIHHRINNQNVKCSSITINSSKLLEYLEKYNIHPNKTCDFEIPIEQIPKQYIWHYVRGLMDADGCIHIRKNRTYNPYNISFVAKNKKCVEQMKKIWNIDNKIVERNGIFFLSKEGKDVLSILDKIYKDSSDQNRLQRKYAKYRSITE